MKKVLLVSAITLSAMLVAPSQTSSDQAKKSPVEGTWEFVAAPRLSPPRKEIKIILGGHFVFARYNAETGNLIYAGGGTYTLNSTSYTEHGYVYYHCTGYRGKCPEPYTREEVLERQFSDSLRDLIVPVPVLDWLQAELITSDVNEQAAREQILRRDQAELERLQKRLDVLYDDRLHERIDASTYDKKAA